MHYVILRIAAVLSHVGTDNIIRRYCSKQPSNNEASEYVFLPSTYRKRRTFHARDHQQHL